MGNRGQLQVLRYTVEGQQRVDVKAQQFHKGDKIFPREIAHPFWRPDRDLRKLTRCNRSLMLAASCAWRIFRLCGKPRYI
jgi:hypothetical protein